MTLHQSVNARARSSGPADVVIAIPVRNEIDRIEACVRALSVQRRGPLNILVLFLVNNSTDGTAEWLRSHLDALPIAATVIQANLPAEELSAGRARWLANHAALDAMDPARGMLFMTDGDSCVPPHWVECYGYMLDHGWDAVAGLVDINRDDCEQIVPPLDQRNHLEGRYTRLIDELESHIDPVPHDPWPRHFSASGANMAANVHAIRQLEDFPAMACGEDRAFIRAMEALDMRVRHETQVTVRTSGRLFGRARGGMADTLRYRTHVPGSLCDGRLEYADLACLRASLRARWHELRDRRDHACLEPFAAELGISQNTVSAAAGCQAFGASWHMLEDASPRLVRRHLAPSQLPEEIQRADELLRSVRRGITPAWQPSKAELRA